MTAPAEIIEDLECRLTRKIRLFADGDLPKAHSHFEWLVCSSKFGIGIAVLPNNEVISFNTNSIHSLQKNTEAGDPEVLDLPSRKTFFFKQDVRISFVRISCNQRAVAFGVDSENGAFVYMFDIFAFSSVSEVQPFPLATIKASNGNGKITCLEWNPEAEDLFTVGASDGSLATIKYSLDNRLNFSIVGQITLPSPPTCMCWSPKGKQLTVGDQSGRLHQLKPELTPVRVVDPPSKVQGMDLPVNCAGLFWLANTDWLVVYRQNNRAIRVTIALLTIKKNQAPIWLFFGDLTFQRPNAPQSFDTSLHFVPLMQWNMVFIFAHRSPDFAVVGQRDGNWTTFVMEKYNITMPTNSQKADTYPIGASFDFTCQTNVKLDYENVGSPSLPPQPMLNVLSSGGLLLPYHICSLDQSRPSLTMAPSTFSAQNVMNGPQPVDYQPPTKAIKKEPEPVLQKPIAKVPIPQQQTLFSQQSASIPQAVAPVQPVIQQQPVLTEQEVFEQAQKSFEQALIALTQTKIQLIQTLGVLSSELVYFNEKSENFDSEYVDNLWELAERVHASFDVGIQLIDEASEKSTTITGNLKQVEKIWHKHLMTSNQRKRSGLVSSNLLEDLKIFNVRLQKLDVLTDGVEAEANEIIEEIRTPEEEVEPEPRVIDIFDPVCCAMVELEQELEEERQKLEKERRELAEKNGECLTLEPVIPPISDEDQQRINKVNQAIGKRVSQFAVRLSSLQQQIKFLNVYAKSKGLEQDSSVGSDSEGSLPSPPMLTDEPVRLLASDIKRLMLIVDETTPSSPLVEKEPQTPEEIEPIDEEQLALKEFLDFHAENNPVQIRHVCSKKLVVDETPSPKGTPLRNRMQAANNEVREQYLLKQVETAKQMVIQAKSITVQHKPDTSAIGANIDAVALLNAVKSSEEANRSSQPAVIQTPKPFVKQQPSQPPKTQPVSSSFSSILEKALEAEDESQLESQEAKAQSSSATPSDPFAKKADNDNKTSAKPSTFSFVSQKSEPSQSTQPQAASTPSSFSFAQKKEDGGLSSAFGDLSATGTQPTTTAQQDQSKAPVSFSFNPSKAASTTNAQQTTAAPTNFSFNPQQTAGSSPFGNLSSQAATQSTNQASGGSVSFSFNPSASNTAAQQSNNAFGGNAFGSNQQQTTGWPSSETNNANQSGFGSSSFSFAPQNNSSGFGQTSNQQSGFGSSTQQNNSGFGSGGFGSSQQSSGGFGAGPSFGGSAFGSKPAFGNTQTANTNTTSGFGTGFSSTAGGFSAFANKGSSFGQLAEQAQGQPAGFASPQQQSSPFGSGFGTPASSFGSFGSGSAFNTPQQPKSSAFTAFRK